MRRRWMAISPGDDAGEFLIQAARRGDVGVVRLLLARGADPDYGVDGGVETPLLVAVQSGDMGIVYHLVAAGADPNGRAGPLNCHSPVGAALNVPVSVLYALLRAGADPNGRLCDSFVPDGRRDGPTPLMVAAKAGSVSHVEALLSFGADPAQRDRQGATALDWLMKYQSPVPTIRRMLLAANAPGRK